MLINNILFYNGIYDIICAFSILYYNKNNIFSNIHINIFKLEEEKNNPLVRRLLAYWILTYGMIRLFSSFYNNKDIYIISALTYFIEAFCFEYECLINNNTNSYKIKFISIFSFILGVFILNY